MRRVNLPDPVRGALFLSEMPGRRDPMAETTDRWARNRIDLVVSLTDPTEINRGSPAFARAIEAGEIEPERLAFPIQDFDVPGDRDAYLDFVDRLADRLREGQRMVVHCFGGIGRSGMTAVSILVRLGADLEDALAAVHAAGSQPEHTLQLELCRWIADQNEQL